MIIKLKIVDGKLKHVRPIPYLETIWVCAPKNPPYYYEWNVEYGLNRGTTAAAASHNYVITTSAL